MAFHERFTWVNIVVTLLVAATYLRHVGAQVGTTPVADIAYVGPVVWATVAMIALNILGAITVAIGSAISIEVTGQGSIDDIDRKDERDQSIARRGDLAGYYVTSVLVIGVFVLTVLELPHFWIANALFLAFVVAGLASASTKLVAYRRGL
jgi:hypothetical protein